MGVSATSPLSLTLANNQVSGSISVANAATSGYLTASDWNIFYNKQNAITFGNVISTDMAITGGNGAVIGSGMTLLVNKGNLSSTDIAITCGSGAVLGSGAALTINKGNLTETGSSVLTITGGNNAVLASGATIQVKQANTTQSGYLSASDWNSFNNKISYPAADAAKLAGIAAGAEVNVNADWNATSGDAQILNKPTGQNPGDMLYWNGTAWVNSAGTAYGNEVSFLTLFATIGMSFGGGIIFYIDGTGLHGLISATTDQSTSAQWGCYGTAIGGTSTAIGTGQANTTAIVNGCSTAGIAARICNDLSLNGYDDWFLPSKDELNQMYAQKTAIGGFTNNLYWSSSEDSSNDAWGQGFGSGSQVNVSKNNYGYMRAVRAF